MTNDSESSESQGAADGDKPEGQKYDLCERTARFGETVIQFLKQVPRGPITDPLIVQMVKAGTSIGANYGEADDAFSKREFRHRIGISKKESGESKFWLRMIVAAVPELRLEARTLWKEADELHRIFSAILRRSKDD